MTYYAARLSFLKTSQTSFTKVKSDEPPIVLAEKLLINGPDHYEVPRKRRHIRGRVDFYLGNFLTEGPRLIAFKIGRRKLTKLGAHSDRVFKDVEVEDYPASTVLWSAENQIILIEKPKKDQMSAESIKVSLQDHLNGLLLAYGYAVLIELVKHKSAFWEVIDKHEKIYSIEFVLFAPNFLDSDKSTKELVKSMKEDYDSNETSIKIANENGNLVVNKDDLLISGFLKWIAAGTGKWTALVGSGGEEVSINSDIGPKMLEGKLVNYNAETAKEFTKKTVDSIEKEEETSRKE